MKSKNGAAAPKADCQKGLHDFGQWFWRDSVGVPFKNLKDTGRRRTCSVCGRIDMELVPTEASKQENAKLPKQSVAEEASRLDIAALEIAARAASPGPWEADLDCAPTEFWFDRGYFSVGPAVIGTEHCKPSDQDVADAAFIAAANPAAIIELVRRLREATAQAIQQCIEVASGNHAADVFGDDTQSNIVSALRELMPSSGGRNDERY